MHCPSLIYIYFLYIAFFHWTIELNNRVHLIHSIFFIYIKCSNFPIVNPLNLIYQLSSELCLSVYSACPPNPCGWTEGVVAAGRLSTRDADPWKKKKTPAALPSAAADAVYPCIPQRLFSCHHRLPAFWMSSPRALCCSKFNRFNGIKIKFNLKLKPQCRNHDKPPHVGSQ